MCGKEWCSQVTAYKMTNNLSAAITLPLTGVIKQNVESGKKNNKQKSTKVTFLLVAKEM